MSDLKLRVLQEHLTEAVSVASKATATQTGLAICGHLLLATDNGRLRVVGTDLETRITAWCGAQVETDGTVTLPARQAKKLIASMPDEALTLTGETVKGRPNESLTHTRLKIESERRTLMLEGLRADDFPPTPEFGPWLMSLEPDALRLAIDRLLFATAGDNTRPVLTGVNMSLEGETLKMAAADGFCLSVCELPVRLTPEFQGAALELDIIVPAATLRHVKSLLPRKASDHRQEVTLALYHVADGRAEQARFGGMLGRMACDVDGALIAATFPEYRQLIPEPINVATFNVEALTGEVAAAGQMVPATQTSGIVRLYLTPESIRVVAESEGEGSCEGTVDAVGGTDGRVALNAPKLLNALNSMGTEQATIGLGDSSGRLPMLFRPVGDDSYLHILMPMNVQW